MWLSTICNLSTDVGFPGFQPSTTSLLVEPPCFRRLPVVHGRTAGSLPLVAPSFKTKVVMNAIGTCTEPWEFSEFLRYSDIFVCRPRSHHDILLKSGCIFMIYMIAFRCKRVFSYPLIIISETCMFLVCSSYLHPSSQMRNTMHWLPPVAALPSMPSGEPCHFPLHHDLRRFVGGL